MLNKVFDHLGIRKVQSKNMTDLLKNKMQEYGLKIIEINS